MQARMRSEGVVLVPALAVVGLFVWWAVDDGGYAPTAWLPAALVVLGLLVATVAGLGLERIRLGRPLALALALLGAYTAFSYLTISWAATPGEAFEGSNRTLLFLMVFALFAVLPWRPWTASTTLSGFAVAIGVLALVTLVRLRSAEQIPSLFLDGRLDAPLGYTNGSAALLMTATVMSIALASRRTLPSLLRAALLALGASSLQLSVLCASRGWLFALPIVVVLAFAIVPGRVRLALWTLPPVVGTALALPALLDVYERVDPAAAPQATLAAVVETADRAAGVALLVSAGVLVVGLAMAAADRRLAVPAGVARGVNRAGAALGMLAIVGVAVAGFALADGRPDRRVADYWERSDGYQEAAAGSSRFAVVGSGRPDFWRVSLDAVAAHPLGGLGQDNWSAYYLRHRDSGEQPRWPHSLELRLLVHTGIVGFLLFTAFLTAAVAAALAGRRRAGPEVCAIAGVALLAPAVWLVHGSIDWFWEIPALSGPAFAFLALGGRTMTAGGPTARPPLAPARRRILAAAAAAAALLALVVLVPSLLAARDVAAAARGWRADPALAFDRLDRAARLDPLSAEPLLVAGVIALERGSPRRAERRFADALARDDENWFAYFGRGLAATALGRRARAGADYERSRTLDPENALVDDALARVNGDDPLSSQEAFARLRRDVQVLTGGNGAATR